ncbi:MAG: glycoside hydrolase family 16 protein [Novosphingobium sp.]|nr:glycoside hydrolase family 16 protein [Novosphingobium sp.]
MLLALLTVAAVPATAVEPHRPPAGYELVFADEFDGGSTPDPRHWLYDTHRNAQGWYNNEKQYYAAARPENARIEGGRLIIESRRESLSAAGLRDFGGQKYTSARVISRAATTYGFYEIRVKLPCGRGTWPAIWMLPADPAVTWPEGGEIDIMEHVGFDAGVIHHSVHTKAFNFARGTQQTASHKLPGACTGFHRYQLLWTPTRLVFGVDDAPRFLFDKKRTGRDRWPFDQAMNLLLNVAVGGDWGGRKGIDDAALPARMEIDYVRVYQPRKPAK